MEATLSRVSRRTRSGSFFEGRKKLFPEDELDSWSGKKEHTRELEGCEREPGEKAPD